MIDDKNLFNIIAKAREQLSQNDILALMGSLGTAAQMTQDSRVQQRVEALEMRYVYLLRFIAFNNVDGDNDIADIRQQAATIINLLEQSRRSHTETLYGAQLRYQALRPEENLASLFSDYLSEQSSLAVDSMALTSARSRETLDRLAADIFNRIWTYADNNADDVSLIHSMLLDNEILMPHRMMWTHAVALAYSENLYEDFVSMLVDIVCSSKESSLQRSIAMAWLVTFIPLQGKDTSVLMPAFMHDVKLLSDILYAFIDDVKMYRSDNGDNLSFLAEMSNRLSSLDNSSLSPEDILQSEDYDKVTNFIEEQRTSVDFFFKTIGRQRHFSFFATMANWFIPFDAGHSSLWQITDGEGAVLADMVQRIPSMADGDKYAMILSMTEIPPSMRAQAMQSIVDSQMSMMQHPEYEDALNHAESFDNSSVKVVQMLRRFAKVFPKAGQFAISDSWSYKFFTDATVLDLLAMDDRIRLAEHAYACEQFMIVSLIMRPVFDCLLSQDLHTDNINFPLEPTSRNLDLLYSVGLSVMEEDKAAGLKFLYIYLKLCPSDIDAVIETANLCIRAGEYSYAADILSKSMELHPDNLELLELSAQFDYDRGEIAAALQTSLVIDFMSANDKNKIRIFMCYFYLGEFDLAEQTYVQIAEGKDDADLICSRIALLWMSGEHSKAVECAVAEARKDDNFADLLSNFVSRKVSKAEFIKEHGGFKSLARLVDIVRCSSKNSKYANIFN